MPEKPIIKIALIGNPNAGKSSLFNHLTGMNQKVGNFPGVTVDKKTGSWKINEFLQARIIDLPGTYSIYPRSLDEKVVFDILSDATNPLYPDVAVVIVDASNLKRNLLLFTQVKDLGVPVVLALNMVDTASRSGIKIDLDALKKELKVPMVCINARKGEGLVELKETLANVAEYQSAPFYDVQPLAPELIPLMCEKFNIDNSYRAYQLAQQFEDITILPTAEKDWIREHNLKFQFERGRLQAKETISRYELINDLVAKTVSYNFPTSEDKVTRRLDNIFTHRFFGYLIFLVILFLIFQAIFAWAALPMDLIDLGFSNLSQWLYEVLPKGPLSDLLTQGVIPGVGGVVIFIPQIAILFAFIAILEESGYMSRVVFLMDKIMRKFGLNGKSVVPLISGVACAIPAIMATRSIDNWKDRLITIFVTPLIACSARLPIYTILIALAVPDLRIWGIFNLQGLALFGMYLLGFAAALLSALLMKVILKSKQKSFLIMELPVYRMPRWKNVGFTIYEKVTAFVFEAGKIIVAIAIILWVLASYGPSDKMAMAEQQAISSFGGEAYAEEEYNDRLASLKLEQSYAGIFGRAIEPVIRPLGFDWKIGIALITSFAAREVFVGTMATIYSIGSHPDDEKSIKDRMKSEINPDTGGVRYSMAMSFSLLIFYAFAMQCMSTLAIVYRETKGWKWPLIQLVYMTGLAYVSSFIVFQLLK